MPGQAQSGMLGNDGSDQAYEPKEVRELRGVKRVAVGDSHACALVGSDRRSTERSTIPTIGKSLCA